MEKSNPILDGAATQIAEKAAANPTAVKVMDEAAAHPTADKVIASKEKERIPEQEEKITSSPNVQMFVRDFELLTDTDKESLLNFQDWCTSAKINFLKNSPEWFRGQKNCFLANYPGYAQPAQFQEQYFADLVKNYLKDKKMELDLRRKEFEKQMDPDQAELEKQKAAIKALNKLPDGDKSLLLDHLEKVREDLEKVREVKDMSKEQKLELLAHDPGLNEKVNGFLNTFCIEGSLANEALIDIVVLHLYLAKGKLDSHLTREGDKAADRKPGEKKPGQAISKDGGVAENQVKEGAALEQAGDGLGRK